MGTLFRAVPRMSPFDKITHTIIGCLNSDLEGNGTITVKASKKGISIALEGKILAKGKTPNELRTNFEAVLAKATPPNPAQP